MPTNFYKLESETHAPEGGQPLSDPSSRVLPVDNPVRFTPKARIFRLDGLNQKEKLSSVFRWLAGDPEISGILTGASMV